MSIRLSSWRTALRALSSMRSQSKPRLPFASTLRCVDRLIEARLQTEMLSSSCGRQISVQRLREVDRARVVVEGTVVDRVLPGQPRVAGGLERDQDRLELLARADLLEHAHLAGLGLGDVLGVALRERLAVELVEVGDLERVEEVPVVVVLHALHELVADPDRGVGGAGAAVRVAGVLTQVEELGEVEVPVLHVEAEGAELLAAAADRAQHRVDGVHERDRAGATSCCSSGSASPARAAW